MQHLLDNPGLVTALVTLILAVAGYIGVKTEQAKQGERIVGLQRQADAPPPASTGPTAPPAPQPQPQAQAPQVATTVLTLPANGTAVHIEAVRPMVQPAMAPLAPMDVPPMPAEAPVGPSVGVTGPTDREPVPPVVP